MLQITGNFYNETRTHNSRLQLTSLNGAAFTYPTTQNNGKIVSESASGETITFQYDSLNRLVKASNGSTWGQGFTYDGYGNLTAKTVTLGSAPV